MKECNICKRTFELNNIYFNKTNLSKDGYSNKCKECIYKKVLFVEDGMKACTKCQNILPKENKYFYYNKYKLDGFNSICRVCEGYSYEMETDHSVKVCTQCKVEYPRTTDYFHVNNERLDGLSSNCKRCLLCKDVKIESIEVWYSERSQKFRDRWLITDIKWLYENYLDKEKKEILSYFDKDVNYKTITNLVYKMGLRKLEKNDQWSHDEIIFLVENYADMEQSKLEKQFPNRTWHSIKTKASKLGVHRNSETLSKINSESHIGIKASVEARKRMGISRTGSKNHGWKGGLSPIVTAIRGYVAQWKLDSLAKYDYKCAITNVNDRTLQVHHASKNFSEIMYEAFEQLGLEIHSDLSNYTDEELMSFKSKINELHYHYGLGIPLTKKLHKLFHKEYGLKNNTYEQYEEFKDRILNGDLNNNIIR